MALTYDFDMFAVVPDDVQARYGDTLAEIGLGRFLDTRIAMFRDPATVAALKGADRKIRDCFLRSQFGLDVYDSGLGAGQFPAEDGPARSAAIERLMSHLEALPEDLNWNGFDINDFAMAAVNAQPAEAATAPAPTPEGVPVAPVAEPAVSSRETASMDDFFAGKVSSKPSAPAAATMDDFFSAPAANAAAQSDGAHKGPDMDAFFSDTSGARAVSPDIPQQMSKEDIRLTIDDTPRRRAGFGPVKMGLMALGLFAVIAMLGNGQGATKLVEAATGAKLMAANP